MQALMKLLLILTIFISTNTLGQNLFNTYKGTWINERQEAIIIKDTLNIEYNLQNWLSNNEEWYSRLSFSYHADTLSFYNKYFNYEGNQSDLYSFKVIQVNDSFLIVRPLSSFAKQYFTNRDSIKFVRQEYAVDTSIKFEKLVYNLSSSCFPGPCPEIYVEINNKKAIYLDLTLYKGYSEKDNQHSGSFKAILSDSLYQEVVHLVQTCLLTNLFFPKIEANDGQIVDFIFYFNKKEKHLTSMIPPVIVYKLMDFLNTINTKVSLTRVPPKKKLVE
jgi:hypothetical protein